MSVYAIWPAPALLGISANVAVRSVPWHALAAATDPVVVTVSVEAIVCVCETCNQVLLYDGIEGYEIDAWSALQYPQGTELHESVPKSNHRRLAQRRTHCYIGGCETHRLSREDLLCPKRR